MTVQTDKLLSEQKWSTPRKGRLYQDFVSVLRASPTTLSKVSQQSGVSLDTMKLWGIRTDARVGNLDAALRAIGHKLAIVPMEDTDR